MMGRLRSIFGDPDGLAELVGLIRRLLQDQGKRYWREYTGAILCMATVAITTGMAAWVMKDVIDKVFIAKDPGAVWIIGGSIILIYSIKGLATYGQQVVLARISNGVVVDIQRRIFDHMLALGVGYYDLTHSTHLIARQAFSVQAASSALNLLTIAVSRDGLTLIVLFIVMVHQDPALSGIAVLLMPAAIFGIRSISGQVKTVTLTEFNGFSTVLESVQETARGIRIVKAYNFENTMRLRQEHAIKSFEKAANRLMRLGARSSPLMEVVGGISVALVIVYGGVNVINGEREAGSFFAFITALLLAYEPAKRLARMHLDLSSALIGVRILYEFLDQQALERDDAALPTLTLDRGEIAFSDVVFSYRKAEPVLRGLNLNVRAGERLAIVGRSGAGKTTIMNLLLRFYDADAGAIRIDGQDIHGCSRASVRRQIAYVSQDCFLFGGTILDNIAVGRTDATLEEIEAAAKAAHADDFIRSFEFGYETRCGEHGVQLSGGQRQRIAIARAFLRNARIILLDEATSALDSESERAVHEALRSLCAGRTTVIIAHRLSTVLDADRIALLADGRVLETGGHDALMKLQGAYADLYQTSLKLTDAAIDS